ncbi:UvrD-helicase domain-containing protein [Svornostia abyssi]|uniref:UvrD-helicase domain-containing protein n=1 Tax=Svornostia abyssi TaxID=2898438 RepID=A0ABY5PA52_9ACTN|nr:UvrD-helicase domain-containing protein [Parviterribacteraceae bacterium J379]
MPPADNSSHEAMAAGRTAASNAVLSSESTKRLLVAGPGTGKSFTFQQALKAAGGQGLGLTFIRNLAGDLASDLSGLADVFTFHGYCKYLMHQHDVAGLQEGDYYPPLFQLLLEDLRVLDGPDLTVKDVEHRLHQLNTEGGALDAVLERADYYNAVSHTDLVYRVLGHFEAAQESVPAYALLVVDEYQDFSRLEANFIALLATKSPTLIAGDDDQALYTTMKHASPSFLRELAADGDFDVFELPYCSRCTSVVVAAVNDLLAAATLNGNLQDRIAKQFTCYLPDKEADSTAHPTIIHAECSTANQPYAGRYIAQQIARIPTADIATARKKGHPAALIIGPRPFLDMAYNEVVTKYPQAALAKSAPNDVDILDGYRRLAIDAHSRLGWRIILDQCPHEDSAEVLRRALESNSDLDAGLKDDYKSEHLAISRLVARLLANETLSSEEQAILETATDRSLEQIRLDLDLAQPDRDDAAEVDVAEPEILFTTLVGSKGLSAEHVFIVGLNDGHFPRDPDAVTDEEICSMLVALSRTRKQCHVISTKFLGRGFLEPSAFLTAIERHLDKVTINKDYDFDA